MKNINNELKKNRREFIKEGAISAMAFTVIPRYVLGGKGFIAPSNKLNMACIGIGGKGRVDAEGVSSENIIALCDVDQARAKDPRMFKKNAYDAFPNAHYYQDFREMLEKEKDIDAVTISTPDHTHAIITMAAMEKGKHVYTQKPLTRTVGESRKIMEFAKKTGMITQMGNQGHANVGPRILNELIWQGAIGTVQEVHCWTTHPSRNNKVIWPQGIAHRPENKPPIPSTLNWDLWLGPAPYRDYHPAYVPLKWRGWWDFGGGALGDMGCHIMDYPFWALKLTAPITIEAYSSPVYKETAPWASLITYTFKSGLDDSPVKLKWYDGGLRPNIPKGLKSQNILESNGGVIFKGDSGVIVYGHHKPKPILLAKGKEQDYGTPKEMIPRSIGHYKEWINEIKGSKERAMSNFDYAGPLNEAVLLGNVALRTGDVALKKGNKLLWDAKNMKITNVPEANKYIWEDYRNGWSL
jgi:predicted dehydrogenase